jgi:pimeloyl-ACP methyl ester carboxylesterase
MYLMNIKGKDPKTVLSFGQSLGTAVATHLATQHQVGGVVLEAPFLSATRVARRIFWFFPGVGLLVHSQFDTEESLKQISAPILVVHCNQDPVLPFHLGEEVYDAARPPKDFLEINGYCHEEASLIAPAKYQVALSKFLSNIDKR